MSLTDNERQQYERDFPQEQKIMATLTERWKAEGIRQGMQEGSYRILARQLEKRFGSLDKPTTERLKAASTTELDHWAERILDAETLDEVFRVH